MSVGAHRVRRSMAVVLALAALGAVACVPQPGGGGGGGTPTCPQRSRRVLASDPAGAMQIPRALSPDGSWLVTSTTDPDVLELELTLRRSDGSGDPVVVGRYALEPGDEPSVNRIAVGDDGDVSVIGRPVGAELGVWTWERASGSTVRRDEPAVDPPHALQSLEAKDLAEDGERAVWLERTVPSGEPGGEPSYRTVLAATATGEVLGVVEGDASGALSPDATLAIHDGDLVDLTTGERESLEDARQAILADGMELVDLAFSVPSDGGRYLAWSGFNVVSVPGGTEIRWRIYRWDRDEQRLSRAPAATGSRRAYLVTSDGRVLHHRTTGFANTEDTIREWNPDTGTDAVIDSGMRAHDGSVARPWGLLAAPATSDLQVAAATWVQLLPEAFTLRVARCS